MKKNIIKSLNEKVPIIKVPIKEVFLISVVVVIISISPLHKIHTKKSSTITFTLNQPVQIALSRAKNTNTVLGSLLDNFGLHFSST